MEIQTVRITRCANGLGRASRTCEAARKRLKHYALAALSPLLASGSVRAQAVTRELPESYSYPEPAWSPYLVGALIGLLACATLVFANKKIGASSAYADVAGIMGRALAPWHVRSLRYFRDNPPKLGWTLTLVLATTFGAYLAAFTGGELRASYLQDLWVARFGADSYVLRTLTALAGGSIMAFGARMAGGCTSGHGISGAFQLAVSSWIALIGFFAGGAATAMLLYLT